MERITKTIYLVLIFALLFPASIFASQESEIDRLLREKSEEKQRRELVQKQKEEELARIKKEELERL